MQLMLIVTVRYLCVCCGWQWLKKQAEARQTLTAADEELTEEERNPLWLRDKGKYVFPGFPHHLTFIML